MLTLDRLVDEPVEPSDSVTLPYELRIRSRLRVTLDSGREAALRLARGQVLRQGDRLAGSGGTVVRVKAAVEKVSTARCDDPLRLARACYHLGNRHVPLQVEAGWVRYQHDHVLDAMLVGLGLEVVVEMAPFQPESGAYAMSHHSH